MTASSAALEQKMDVCAAECSWAYEETPMPKPAFNIEAKEFARVLWDRCVVGLAEVGLNGEWLKVNPALCELLEYTESELQSRTFAQLTHPEDLDDDKAMVERLKDGRLDHYVMSKRYITKRGRVIWIKLRVDPVKDDDERVAFFLSQIVPAKEISAKDAPINKKTGEEKFALGRFIKSEWKWIIAATLAVVVFVVQQNTLQVQAEHEIKSNRESIQRIEKALEAISTKLEKK